jgi:hypothetical protein
MSEQQNDPKVVQLNREAAQPQPVIDKDFLARVIEQTVQHVEQRLQRISPFNLNTMEDVVLFAEHTAKSGLCPKAYRDKPDDIITAVIFGREVGLPAMTALASIAVIEGQPQLWGPAVAGVCLATGKVEDHTYAWEGEPGTPEFTAICTVTRKGFSPVEGRFSQADMQQAGLLSRAKDTMPWKAYPRDMLMWKASHRAWRQAFPDVIKGLSGAQPPTQDMADEWPMPRPEVRWRAIRPQMKDGWQVVWFNGACERLRTAVDTREWLVTLAALLQEAPTLRDVDELDSWEMTQAVVGNARENWRLRIEEVFGEARKRFIQTEKPADVPADAPVDQSTGQQAPKTEKPPQRRRAAPKPEVPPVSDVQPGGEPPAASQQTPVDETGFDYPLVDAIGEVVGDNTYDDPVAWARAFIEVWTNAAPDVLEPLEAHNADAIADACAASDEAKAILADLGAEEQLEVVAIPQERGRPNAIAYLKDIRNAMASLIPGNFAVWVDLQRPNIDTVPMSSRMLVIKSVLARATELKLPAPVFQAAPLSDKDDRLAATIMDHADTLTTVDAVNSYSQEGSVTVPLKRWETERPALATKVRSAFAERIELIKAGGRAV